MRSLARYANMITWALGLLTLAWLLVFHPIPSLETMPPLWPFVAGLIGLACNFGIALTYGQITGAHAFVMLAYLAMGGDEGTAWALWATVTGTLLGVLARDWGDGGLRKAVPGALMETADVTLSLLIAGDLVYVPLGGELPLTDPSVGNSPALAAFALVFLAAFNAQIGLRWALDGEEPGVLFRANGRVMALMEVVPLPFVVLGAVVYNRLPAIMFVTLGCGMAAVAAGVHLMSRVQARYRQRLREAASINSVGRAMRTSLDMDTLLETLYLQVAHLLGVDSFEVALVDPTTNSLRFPLAVREGRHESRPPRPMGHGLVEYVIENRAPLLIESDVIRTAKGMGLEPPEVAPYSWLGVPLLAPDRALGCIVVSSYRPDRPLDRHHLHMLTTIAPHASMAVENALLYGQMRDRAAQMVTLNELAARMSSSLQRERVQELAADAMLKLAHCDAAAIFLKDGEDEVKPAYTLAVSADELPGLPCHPDDHAGPIFRADLRKASDVLHAAEFTSAGFRALIQLPLHAPGGTIGALVGLYRRPFHLAGDELELLQAFANQVALSLSNARLYEMTDKALALRVEQLSALTEVNRELSATLDLEHLFQMVLDRAMEATESRYGALMIRHPEKPGFMQVVAARGYDSTPRAGEVMPLDNVTGRVLQNGQVAVLDEVREEPEYVPFSPDVRSQMSVPIIHEGRPEGVITLESDVPSAYDPDKVDFVTQLAIQAALAIHNARLFAQITETNERLRAILNSTREGMLMIDREGEILMVNSRLGELIGMDVDGWVHTKLVRLLAEPALRVPQRFGFEPQEMLDLLDGLRNRELPDLRTFTYPLEGERYLERSVTPVLDEEMRLIGVLMVLRDVTEQEELAQTREALTSMIVHDLRSPLTAVMSSLKLINELIPPESDLRDVIARVTDTSIRAVRKLLNLVESLLDISKMESGSMELTRDIHSLEAIIREAWDTLEPLANELGVEMVLDVPPDLPPVDVDDYKVERVLGNLLDNALKYAPEGGKVGVRAYMPGENGAPPGYVRVDVWDTGPGIPDEYKPRIFDRFVQVRGRRGRRRGTGLGLTYCKMAVEAHGGRIWLEDRPGGGTVFAFTLPVAVEDGR